MSSSHLLPTALSLATIFTTILSFALDTHPTRMFVACQNSCTHSLTRVTIVSPSITRIADSPLATTLPPTNYHNDCSISSRGSSHSAPGERGPGERGGGRYGYTRDDCRRWLSQGRSFSHTWLLSGITDNTVRVLYPSRCNDTPYPRARAQKKNYPMGWVSR